MRGVDEDTNVGMLAWRMVTGMRLGGQDIEGRREREGYMVRGGALVGVTIKRVRTRSRGERANAAIAAAATATERESIGLGLSTISRPPIPPVPTRAESGMLRSAESKLLVQLSVVLSKKL